MISKTVCSACGADSAPDGARFCPSCGASLTNTSENVPMVPATPLEDHTTSTVTGTPLANDTIRASSVALASEASTVTYDEPPAPPADPNNCNCSGQPQAAASTTTSSLEPGLYCANYFLNPTSDMLERSKSQALGGILFLETNDLKGKFTVAQEISVGRILGGVQLDLSVADFVHPTTTITAGAVLGGLKVIVPRGVRVETKGIGILGGFAGLTSGQTVHAGQDAPLVIVQGVSILGGVKVSLNEEVPPLKFVK